MLLSKQMNLLSKYWVFFTCYISYDLRSMWMLAERRYFKRFKHLLWHASEDPRFWPHHFQNCLKESGGLMQDRCFRHLHYSTVYLVSAFMLRSTPSSCICTKHWGDINVPLSVYHSYQRTAEITPAADSAHLPQSPNCTDKVLLQHFRWCHHFW